MTVWCHIFCSWVILLTWMIHFFFYDINVLKKIICSTFWHWKAAYLCQIEVQFKIGVLRFCHQQMVVWCHNIFSSLNILSFTTNIIFYDTNVIKKNISSTFWHWKLIELCLSQDWGYTDFAIKKLLFDAITFVLALFFLLE